MSPSQRETWFRAALLLGAVYFLIGRLFALPGDHLRAWRLAAWIVSGCAFAAHIGYEHFRVRNTARSAAAHVAVGVALGAVALAIAAMVHSLSSGSGLRPVWLLALVAWPAFTAVPAFLVAYALEAALRRVPPPDLPSPSGR